MAAIKTGLRLRSKKGFSVIELVVVIVVAGILAAMAVSRAMDSSAFNAREAAAMVGTDIRRTQELAMANIVPCRIVFNGTGNYRIIQDPEGANTLLEDKTIPAGITASSAAITFNSLGEPNGGVTVNVGGESVTVAPFTGRVDYL